MTVMLHLRNSTPGLAPAADNLQQGQLAINTADATLWTLNSSGVVKKIGDANFASLTNPSFNGTVTLNGSYVTINGSSGTFQRYTTNTANSPTWEWGTDGVAQTGSNAGSNWNLYAFSDSATVLYTAISITRATGATALYARPTFNGNLAWDAGNFNPANYLPLTGGTLSGQLQLSGAAGSNVRQIRYETTGVLRWIEGVDIEAEGGSNTGSNWTLSAYSDAGSSLTTAIIANRATGVVSFGSIPTHQTPAAGDNSTNSATTGFVQQAKYANAARTSTVQATTVGVFDYYVGINYAGASTVNLPGSSWGQGQTVVIKDESGKAATNNITITTGGALIDGKSSVALALNYGSVTLLWNTSFWSII
jgi:hypothetical protein